MPDLSLENNAGNRTRVLSLLKYFKERNFEVDYFGVKDWCKWEEGAVEKMMDTGLINQVFVSTRRPPRSQPLKRFFIYKLPSFFLKKITLPNLAPSYLCRQFNKVLKQNEYDYIIVNYTTWANLVRNNKYLKGARTIIDTHDFLTIQEYKKYRKHVGQIFEEEIKRLSYFDEVWAVSVDEYYVFSQFLTNIVRLVPNIPLSVLNRNQITDSKKKYDIIYVASDNLYNQQAVAWFISNVYPLLPNDISICIVGKINNHITASYSNIDKISFVEDLATVYSESKVAVCPMLDGTGIKLKVLEAMSFALPIVCNLRGLDGLPNKINNGCLVSDDAKEFANHIVRLLSDEVLYNQLSKQAYDLYEAYFNPEVRYKQLDLIFEANTLK